MWNRDGQFVNNIATVQCLLVYKLISIIIIYWMRIMSFRVRFVACNNHDSHDIIIHKIVYLYIYQPKISISFSLQWKKLYFHIL